LRPDQTYLTHFSAARRMAGGFFASATKMSENENRNQLLCRKNAIFYGIFSE
jgi:hypothetical protein